MLRLARHLITTRSWSAGSLEAQSFSVDRDCGGLCQAEGPYNESVQSTVLSRVLLTGLWHLWRFVSCVLSLRKPNGR